MANLRFLAKIDYIDIDVDLDIDIRYRHSTLRIEKNLPAPLRCRSMVV